MSNALGHMQQPAARVAGWLQTCDNDHKECQQPFDPASPANYRLRTWDYAARFPNQYIPKLLFRLLDLEPGCVRNASLDDRYVAFSYFSSDSAASPSFRLTKSGPESAATKGWLGTVRPSLDKSVSDAIDFFRVVGEWYCCVDALCFARDPGRDKRHCERMVTFVYQSNGTAQDAGRISAPPPPGWRPRHFYVDDYRLPYLVIEARTICLRLKMGQPPERGSVASDVLSNPALPLHSASNKVVRLVHPDNMAEASAAAASSPIADLVVLSLFRAPTAGLALGETTSLSGTACLVWVMHVEWKDGLAQRRGIRQILVSALSNALEPSPKVV
ncbi:hypothetical protein GGTG_12908 [Gaeumannomyces tritici R3-111a-1]|uniref:Heterokaryon incompatibility domain-containing protein n=1 Tax=Gaeumannomyces tritici (strain R3-111a-1) TaxID=644352 RepID=J3PHC9_GAET3|nr:hypothetical protein GGTG_12908 [Gaeumannomyces tritici R3-111a-1]EJT69289.1 hypothetical protein GGTG_12908 [Gaeumannomyces tritici R3-111a-1]